MGKGKVIAGTPCKAALMQGKQSDFLRAFLHHGSHPFMGPYFSRFEKEDFELKNRGASGGGKKS